MEPFVRMLYNRLDVRRNARHIFTVRAYADDVNVVIENPTNEETVSDVLNIFTQATTATVNRQKSSLLPLGQWPKETSILGFPVKDQVKILGLNFTQNIQTSMDSNWKRLVNNIRGVIFQNMSRHLNLIQKIWYINVFALAKIWYTAQIFPINNKYAQQIETIFGIYIWKGFLYRIKKEQLQLFNKQGGLNLTAVKDKCNALLAKVIIRSLQEKQDEQDAHFWKNKLTNHKICTQNIPPVFHPVCAILNELPQEIWEAEKTTSQQIPSPCRS